ncbi:MAG: metallophosphoesterase, partial [Flavobacteriales bacterium]|nr:metallophosphoesterase [Flavobacteriales bacterium]
MSEVQVRGERLELLPAKALWWPRARVLVIADMHMGKATHFRKAGIAVPGAVEQRNVQRAQALLAHYAPHEVLLLGDLFHSRHNGS